MVEPVGIGIVGAEAAKFTPEAESCARQQIRQILHGALIEHDRIRLVSGGCHLGGIDIWAEEEYARLAPDFGNRFAEPLIHLPATRSWAGYKPRNLLIARDSAIVHCIVVRKYPATFKGRRFNFCYHCCSNDHVKSGGCWTALQAERLGHKAEWHII